MKTSFIQRQIVYLIIILVNVIFAGSMYAQVTIRPVKEYKIPSEVKNTILDGIDLSILLNKEEKDIK